MGIELEKRLGIDCLGMDDQLHKLEHMNIDKNAIKIERKRWENHQKYLQLAHEFNDLSESEKERFYPRETGKKERYTRAILNYALTHKNDRSLQEYINQRLTYLREKRR